VSDNRFLLRQRQCWWAVVEVPPSLRPTLGRRLKRTLQTRDVAVARARRWAVVATLKGLIDKARKAQQGDPVVAEALAWRGYLAAAEADSADGFSATEDATRDAVGDRVEELYRQGDHRWKAFRDIASGAATPVTFHGEEWLNGAGLRGKPIGARTVALRRTHLRDFAEWLSSQGEPGTLEGVTRKVAGRYADFLSARSTSVAMARVTALRAYWIWLEMRGHVPEETRNPWAGLGPKVRAGGAGVAGEKERAFTRLEVALLLNKAPAQEVLRDFILAGALSGMRREELGRLRVRDCLDGVFVVRSGKTEAASRRVPIHPALASIVERLAGGKSPDAWLFDLPGEGRRYGERTEAIGKAFMRHRRVCGLQDGEARRSLLNFHSLRRFFVTEAINAGQPTHLVSRVVGHAEGRKGMTMGTYWARPSDDVLRPIVEAVRIPGVA